MPISAQEVKQLREKTGAGLMDCKRALQEAQGDEQKAMRLLRERGIEIAGKKAGREANEGQIVSYIHAGGKVGVLLELNCETDFVARNEAFQHLGRELAMQIAAYADTAYVSREDVPEADIEAEKDVLRAQAEKDPRPKPAHIIEKIVTGRLGKFYQRVCLMDQAYIRDDSRTVQDVVNDLIAKMGERILVRRFCRYQVGEELEG